MKICPKCNTGNNDNAVQCKDCGYSISKVNMEEYHNYIQELEEKNKRKHRKNMLIHSIALLIFGILYIYLYIKALSNLNVFELTCFAVIPQVAAFLMIHHPKTLFILGYLLTIDNIDDVELSDWYIFWNKISGIMFIIMGFVCMAIFANVIVPFEI